MPAESLIERYRNAALALLPPGRAFSRAPDLSVGKLLEALSVEWARIHEDVDTLYRNCNPAAADEYLPEWETALELPGPCVTEQGSLAERQGAVVTKLRGRTSHAQAAFESAAEALGYTDLEFVRFAPFEVGVSAVGSALYDLGWMHVVRAYVAVGSQTADDSLVCTFVDELRRSHGFVDVILEGPMGAERKGTKLYDKLNMLGADQVVADIAAFAVSYGGHVSIQVLIDTVGDGSGSAPTDTPVGVWELWCSADGVLFTQLTSAAIVAELAKIAPNGNNKVSAWAVFDGVPGTSVKLRYNQTSGGGGNSRCTALVAVW